MMKKLLEIDHDDTINDDEDGKPIITGSMLPYYYSSSTLSSGTTSILNDLERISNLKEKGLLTGKEFELCKSKLFNNMNR